MPLPTPEIGLVVHYGFVWVSPSRRPPPDAGNDRPCLIVDCRRIEEPAMAAQPTIRVTYLPISHVAPRGDERAIGIPPRVAKHLGLTSEDSHLYISYAVEDGWPFDLALAPGARDQFDDGFVPPRFFEAIAARFAAHLASHPRFIHRR